MCTGNWEEISLEGFEGVEGKCEFLYITIWDICQLTLWKHFYRHRLAQFSGIQISWTSY